MLSSGSVETKRSHSSLHTVFCDKLLVWADGFKYIFQCERLSTSFKQDVPEKFDLTCIIDFSHQTVEPASNFVNFLGQFAHLLEALSRELIVMIEVIAWIRRIVVWASWLKAVRNPPQISIYLLEHGILFFDVLQTNASPLKGCYILTTPPRHQ